MTPLHVLLRVNKRPRVYSIDYETEESERFSEQPKATQPSGRE